MMNLPVIFSNVKHVAVGALSGGKLLVKKHAPEIMIGSGIAGYLLTIVGTIKATNKTNDILEAKSKREELLAVESRSNPDYTPEMYSTDIRELKKRTRRGLVKAWAPVVTGGMASTALVLGGYRIINGRYVATAAAYKTLESSYDHYRENVRKEFGDDTDWRMANGYSEEELEAIQKEREEMKKAEDSAKGRKRKRKGPYRGKYTIQQEYIFDEYSANWKRYWTAEQMLDYIRFKVKQLNDKFNLQGYLFVNDVLTAFGLEPTAAGQVVGWIRKRGKTTIVSVGLDEAPDEEIRRILSITDNEDLRWILHLNPDGVIYNLIDDVDLRDRYLIE